VVAAEIGYGPWRASAAAAAARTGDHGESTDDDERLAGSMTDSPNGRNPFFPEEPDNNGRGDSQYQPNYDTQYQPPYDPQYDAQRRPEYDAQYEEPEYDEATVGRHGGRRRRGGVVTPILGALAVLALLAGAGWYVTRDTTTPTSQDEPLTVTTEDSPTPTDELSTPPATPSATPTRTPSATPSATPSKTPSKAPKATPTRSTTAPSRAGTRSPKPSPEPTKSTVPTKKPTKKLPVPSSGSAEAQVLQLTNQERAKAGCGALRTNSALTRAAEAHASDMVVNHYFDHNSQDGRSPFDRMKAAGFSGGSMAENIAVGYSSAAAVVDGWMNSEGHRKNILNCSYTMIGIGYDSGVVKPSWGGGSWVQDFGG
jgi:uncharacterized protein YkwD